MIEHVRSRCVNCRSYGKIIVASGDDEILDLISNYGGHTIKTNKKHQNGTSRIAEGNREY